MIKTIIRAQEKNVHKSISLAAKAFLLLQIYRQQSAQIKMQAKWTCTKNVTNFYASIILFQIGNNSFLKMKWLKI